MKQLLTLLFVAISAATFAQAPQGINYQAVIRDNGGAVLANQAVGMKVAILQGSPSGTAVYEESFSPTTSQFGLVNVVIGQGTIISGDFTTINWSAGPYYAEVSADETGGTNYAVLGTQQLMSVPYSLYAETAENVTNDQVDDADADPNNEIQDISLTGTDLTISGGSTVDLSVIQDGVNDADADPNNEIQAISFSNDTLYLSNGGQVYLGAYGVDLVDDADADPTNELQNWSNLPGIPVELTDGDDVDDADADPNNEIQAISFSNDTLYLSNGGQVYLGAYGVDLVNDADADPTNELQSWSTLPGIPGDFSDNIDNVNDADNDPNNELQALSLSNDTLYLSNGNNVYLGTLFENDSVLVNGISTYNNLPEYLFLTGDCSDGNFETAGNYNLTNTFAQYCNLKINSGDVFNLGLNNQTDIGKTYTILVSDTLFLDGTINGVNQRNSEICIGSNQTAPSCVGITAGAGGGSGTSGCSGCGGGMSEKNIGGESTEISWDMYNAPGTEIIPPTYSIIISGGANAGNGEYCLSLPQITGQSSSTQILEEAIKIRSNLHAGDGGNTSNNASQYYGGAGEGGDGLYLICRVVSIGNTGVINLSGNNGQYQTISTFGTWAAGGGGGGSLVISADEILNQSGTIISNGGSGLNNGTGNACDSGPGGSGASLVIEY